MAKNYKLESKKKIKDKAAADGRFYIKTGLFHRYVASRMSGIVIIVLEVLSLIITTIFAMVLGIFGSVIMGQEYAGSLVVTDSMSEKTAELINSIAAYILPANNMWLISSVIYIIGTFVLILGFSRIASAIHGSATVLTLVSYSMMMSAHDLMGSERSPAAIMMPCIFITIISVSIAMLVFIPRWLDKKNERDSAPAPSILGDKED